MPALKALGCGILSAAVLYLLLCFAVKKALLAFFGGELLYQDFSGAVQALNPAGLRLVEFYNLFSAPLLVYANLFGLYPFTTVLITSLALSMLVWMCLTAPEKTPAEDEDTAERERESFFGKTGVSSSAGQPQAAAAESGSSYKEYLAKIEEAVTDLKNMWDVGYLDSYTFGEWYDKFKPLEEICKCRFPGNTRVTWVFWELNQLGSALSDVEKIQKKYRQSIQEDAPPDLVQNLEGLLKQNQHSASDAVMQAVRYCALAREEA